MTYYPKMSWTKADLLATIERLQVELHHANACRQSAWKEAQAARAETATVLEQKPELEAFRDFAKGLDFDPSGSIEEILNLATKRFQDLEEKNQNWARCDECGEKTEHHLCDAHWGDPLGALEDVLAELETVPRDATECRMQREAIERIAEEYTGRSPQLRRAS